MYRSILYYYTRKYMYIFAIISATFVGKPKRLSTYLYTDYKLFVLQGIPPTQGTQVDQGMP